MVHYLIFYAAEEDGDNARIIGRIQSVVPRKSILVCRTIQQLSRSLLRPLSEVLAVVLLVADEADLKKTLLLQEVLHETRVILILPDSENKFMAASHSLRPRFITYANDEPDDLVAVLRKWVWMAAQDGFERKDERRANRMERQHRGLTL